MPTPGAATSDHGWDLRKDSERLKPIVEQLKSFGCRVSIFTDPKPDAMELAALLPRFRFDAEHALPRSDASPQARAEALRLARAELAKLKQDKPQDCDFACEVAFLTLEAIGEEQDIENILAGPFPRLDCAQLRRGRVRGRRGQSHERGRVGPARPGRRGRQPFREPGPAATRAVGQ